MSKNEGKATAKFVIRLKSNNFKIKEYIDKKG